MADLQLEIGDLQAQFQRIADLHPWVCLAMPPWGKVGIPTIGEAVMPSAPPPARLGKILDGSGQPMPPFKPSLEERAAYCKAVGAIRHSDEHGRDRDASIEEVAKVIQDMESHNRMLELHGPPPWVMSPRDFKRCRVTEHVAALTWKAERLLLRVLDGPNQIPSDIQEQIRERKKQCEWYAWVFWLQYSAVVYGPHYRIENYPQAAATALMALRDVVSAKIESPRPTVAVAAEPPADAGTPLTAAERAMQIFLRDTSRSKAEVARQAGCHPSLLSREGPFTRLWDMHHGTVPKGSKAKDGTMEAEVDEESA